MHANGEFLNPAEAAQRLGVSAKALRVYEQRGLVAPKRAANGWRVYGPEEMSRAAEIVAYRALGFGLTQIARILSGDARAIEDVLAAHQAALEQRQSNLAVTIEKLRSVRDGIAGGNAPRLEELTRLLKPETQIVAAFDLPWPWGGERFELKDLRALNYIVGPLGSGKTRLAMRIAETIPGAVFLGLDRAADDGAAARAHLDANPALRGRVGAIVTELIEDGATESGALIALLTALEDGAAAVTVVDMIEQGLDEATQEALIAHLRRRGENARPIFMLTRSSAILDLPSAGAGEAIILCPANHSPPTRVAAIPGAPGYEAVATCLAPPAVRARTEGLIAWRPQVA